MWGASSVHLSPVTTVESRVLLQSDDLTALNNCSQSIRKDRTGSAGP